MEIIVLVLVMIALFWVLGFFKSVIRLADVANREAAFVDRKHKSYVINKTADLKVNKTKYDAAKTVVADLDKFDDL